MTVKLLLESQFGARIHREYLNELFEKSQGSISIVSPYIRELDLVLGWSTHNVRLITSTDPEDIVSGASSLDALEGILRSNITCRYFPRPPLLHAKVYLFEGVAAVITSANLTQAGIDRNIEAGVVVDGDELEELQIWFDTLWQESENLVLSHLTNAISAIDERKAWLEGQGRQGPAKPSWGITRRKSNNAAAVGSNRDRREKSKRLRVFELLASKECTGKQVSLELFGKPDHIPYELKDEQFPTENGTLPRIDCKKVTGERGVIYFLTETGLTALRDGTVDSDIPSRSIGTRAPGQVRDQ